MFGLSTPQSTEGTQNAYGSRRVVANPEVTSNLNPPRDVGIAHGILARRQAGIAVAKGVYRDPSNSPHEPGDPALSPEVPQSRSPSVPESLSLEVP
jgi:hypothetical protein